MHFTKYVTRALRVPCAFFVSSRTFLYGTRLCNSVHVKPFATAAYATSYTMYYAAAAYTTPICDLCSCHALFTNVCHRRSPMPRPTHMYYATVAHALPICVWFMPPLLFTMYPPLLMPRPICICSMQCLRMPRPICKYTSETADQSTHLCMDVEFHCSTCHALSANVILSALRMPRLIFKCNYICHRCS